MVYWFICIRLRLEDRKVIVKIILKYSEKKNNMLLFVYFHLSLKPYHTFQPLIMVLNADSSSN